MHHIVQISIIRHALLFPVDGRGVDHLVLGLAAADPEGFGGDGVDLEGGLAFEDHDVGFVARVHEPVADFVLVDGDDVGVSRAGDARGVGFVAEGQGEGVGGLVDGGFGFFGVREGVKLEVFVEAGFVFGVDLRGEVGACGAVEFEFGEGALGGGVVVCVEGVVEVPEEVVVLLHLAQRWWALDFCGLLERIVAAEDAPVHEQAEVLHPLAEAGDFGLGAVDEVGVLWPKESTSIVGPDVHV